MNIRLPANPAIYLIMVGLRLQDQSKNSMCITAQRIVTRDYIYMHPNRSKTYISLAKALPAQGTVHASPVVSDTTSFPLHSSNQSHIFQPLTHSFIQIRPFRVLYSFLACLLLSLPIISYLTAYGSSASL